MKRIVTISELKMASGMTIRVMSEAYSNSAILPTSNIFLDINEMNIIGRNAFERLPITYINSFIRGILGSSSNLPDTSLINAEFNKVPTYNLSEFALNSDLSLEFDGYILIQDSSLVELKSDLISEISEMSSEDEIVSYLKSKFNLVEPGTVDDYHGDKGFSAIRPLNIDGITKLFSNYLSSQSYIKGNCIEFQIPNPFSDFISNGADTELMTQIREFYSDWLRIEVAELQSNKIDYEVYPISDSNLYLKVGDRFVTEVPEDIQVLKDGDEIDLFQSGPQLPKIVVTDGESEIDLNLDTIRVKTISGNLESISGVKYRSKTTGNISQSVYYLDPDGEYKDIDGVSRTLAMFNAKKTQISGSIFRFYFK